MRTRELQAIGRLGDKRQVSDWSEVGESAVGRVSGVATWDAGPVRHPPGAATPTFAHRKRSRRGRNDEAMPHPRAESADESAPLLTLLGIAVLLHGLAHANAGMLAANDGSVVATLLWAPASVGFLAAGLGLIGVRRLPNRGERSASPPPDARSSCWRPTGPRGAGKPNVALR